MPLESRYMSGPYGEEHANLYMRGVNEAASGMELDAQEVLDVLDMLGEDGVRMESSRVLASRGQARPSSSCATAWPSPGF